MDIWLQQLLDDLRAGRAGELAGSRVAADVAASDALINRLIAEKLPPGGAVRDVTVRCGDGHMRVTVRVARPSFLPPITVTLTVDRQPDLPASPTLVLRVGMMPGVAMFVGSGLNFLNVLPPGHRLDGERLFIDIAAVLQDRGFAWAMPYLQELHVTMQEGRLLNRVVLATRQPD